MLPVIGAKTKFQPLYVGDAADAIAAAVEGQVQTGRIYELGGPQVLTHREIIERVLHETMRSNPLIPVPRAIGKLLAAPFALLPFAPLLTGDQVEMLQADNIVSAEATNDKRTGLAGAECQPFQRVLGNRDVAGGSTLRLVLRDVDIGR